MARGDTAAFNIYKRLKHYLDVELDAHKRRLLN